MDRIVWTDQQLRAGPDKSSCGFEQPLAYCVPTAAIDQVLVTAERKAVETDLWVSMGTEQRGSFKTNGAVAERSPLCADCDNPDVLHIVSPAMELSALQRRAPKGTRSEAQSEAGLQSRPPAAGV